MLFNNDNLIINNKDDMCEFKNNIIKYKDKDGINVIDLNNKKYERENKEYILKIDFNDNSFNFILKEENHIINSTINNSSFNILDNKIILKYSIDDEEKKIIIQLS